MHPRVELNQFIRKFELLLVTSLQILLVILTGSAAVYLWALFLKDIFMYFAQWKIETLEGLREPLQIVFGAVLIVLLGLELLESVALYFRERRIRAEIILIVAMIAVGRHVVQVDIEHTSPLSLLSVGGLLLAIALGYFFVIKAHRIEAETPPEAVAEPSAEART